MPLPLTVSCFSGIQIGFTFLVPAHPDSPGQRAVKRVCVCVWNSKIPRRLLFWTWYLHCRSVDWSSGFRAHARTSFSRPSFSVNPFHKGWSCPTVAVDYFCDCSWFDIFGSFFSAAAPSPTNCLYRATLYCRFFINSHLRRVHHSITCLKNNEKLHFLFFVLQFHVRHFHVLLFHALRLMSCMKFHVLQCWWSVIFMSAIFSQDVFVLFWGYVRSYISISTCLHLWIFL